MFFSKFKSRLSKRVIQVLALTILASVFTPIGAHAVSVLSVCATGCAHTTIQGAINAASSGDTINVSAGTYVENVNVNKAVAIIGAGAAATSIVATTGNSNPLTFSTNGATLSGFTITHAYTPIEISTWTFNNNGVIFNMGTSGNTLSNNSITLNRNAIYLHTASAKIFNNIITNNRSGINLTNNVSGTEITNNTISLNWTLGVVFYATAATDFSSVLVTGNTFNQNWYSEILIKDASTSSGTLNLFSNTFTDTPVSYTTANASISSLSEPAFLVQNPLSPVAPATMPTQDIPTLRIYNSGSVILNYPNKSLKVGTNKPYATIQSAINDASSGDKIVVDAGTYIENVNVDKAVTIIGAGAAATSIVATTGNSDPLTFSTNGATVSGFTITHAYTVSELSTGNWTLSSNNGISNTGVLFNPGTTGNTLSNNTITLNRNGIAIVGAEAKIQGNTITNNRTGINVSSKIDGTEISNNAISNNWTLGIVYSIAGSGATNFSTVRVTGNTFNQNWYSEILIKDAVTSAFTGTGTLDVSSNTFTETPVTNSISADPSLNEPLFKDQQPVSLGGSAVKPSTDLPTLRIYNSGSVRINYTDPSIAIAAAAAAEAARVAAEGAARVAAEGAARVAAEEAARIAVANSLIAEAARIASILSIKESTSDIRDASVVSSDAIVIANLLAQAGDQKGGVSKLVTDKALVVAQKKINEDIAQVTLALKLIADAAALAKVNFVPGTAAAAIAAKLITDQATLVAAAYLVHDKALTAAAAKLIADDASGLKAAKELIDKAFLLAALNYVDSSAGASAAKIISDKALVVAAAKVLADKALADTAAKLLSAKALSTSASAIDPNSPATDSAAAAVLNEAQAIEAAKAILGNADSLDAALAILVEAIAVENARALANKKVISRVFFETKSSKLDAAAKKVLTKFATLLKSQKSVAITLTGYADASVSKADKGLSLRRASVVAAYLNSLRLSVSVRTVGSGATAALIGKPGSTSSRVDLTIQS